MPFVFPHFIMAAIPHVKCDVGCGRENETRISKNFDILLHFMLQKLALFHTCFMIFVM